MTASMYEHFEVVKWLLKAGANPKMLASPSPGPLESFISSNPGADVSKASFQISLQNITALYFSEGVDASTEQTAYLETNTYCSSPDCRAQGSKSARDANRHNIAGRRASWRTGRRTRPTANDGLWS
jgi:hypothetical protein